ESVGDPEEEVRDHDFAPRRLRKHRDREREGAAGFLEEILEGDGLHDASIRARNAPRLADKSCMRRRIRRSVPHDEGSRSARRTTSPRRMLPSVPRAWARKAGNSSSAASLMARTTT